MGIWELVVGIFVLLFSVIMIIVIILQEGHESNLGAITGGADSFLSRGKAKTADAIFAKFTKYCAIAFFVLVVLLNALSYFDIKGNSISGSDAEPETSVTSTVSEPESSAEASEEESAAAGDVSSEESKEESVVASETSEAVSTEESSAESSEEVSEEESSAEESSEEVSEEESSEDSAEA